MLAALTSTISCEVASDDPTLHQGASAAEYSGRKPESLLDIVDPTASIPSETSEPDNEIGTKIGSYKILSKLGEGGFGIVYLAEQKEPVARKVALKILKLGMDSKQIVGRFEGERKALAFLDHPNIGKVLDAGVTELGRPYFAMELIKGLPLIEFCDHHKMSVRDRLKLFTKVCDAVDHAHRCGIIHRDLKPSNVLVSMQDDRPVPKLIDFGIAKATRMDLTDRTVFTRYEDIIGTPAYMSPEQATSGGLEVDHRTDIYALGVLLYELLTGKPPVDPKSLSARSAEQIRSLLRDVEPSTPSKRVGTLEQREVHKVAGKRSTNPCKLRKLLRQDVDWIIMKAMEKDRIRRYGTASELANDIQRHLSGELVRAARPGLLCRARKFATKHWMAMSAASTALAAFGAGVLVGATL